MIIHWYLNSLDRCNFVVGYPSYKISCIPYQQHDPTRSLSWTGLSLQLMSAIPLTSLFIVCSHLLSGDSDKQCICDWGRVWGDSNLNKICYVANFCLQHLLQKLPIRTENFFYMLQDARIVRFQNPITCKRFYPLLAPNEIPFSMKPWITIDNNMYCYACLYCHVAGFYVVTS